MKTWFQNLLKAVKVRTLIIAAAVFIVGNWSLHFLVLSPNDAMVKTVKADLEEMKETYVQLKSADMSVIKESLEREVQYLNEKQERVFSNLYEEEQIPLLISRLEQEAESAGLDVSTKIERNNRKVKKKKKAPFTLIAINLNYGGTFEQLFSFLNKLRQWDEGVLVRRFQVYNGDSLGNNLNGYLQFISLINKPDEQA